MCCKQELFFNCNFENNRWLIPSFLQQLNNSLEGVVTLNIDNVYITIDLIIDVSIEKKIFKEKKII